MFKLKFGPFEPLSNSAFQLGFKGLKVKKGKPTDPAKFIKALLLYFSAKIRIVGKFSIDLFRVLFLFAQGAKVFVVRKLIWSQGKLGRPAANIAILFTAFLVFLTGGVFSGTPFVNSAQISPDYLASVDSVISGVTIATTSLPEGRRSESIIHEVRPGETLSSIGSLYKVTTDALKYVNSLSDEDFLKIGQKLTIPPVQGIIYKIKSGDTCDSIAKKFDVSSQAILDFNYLESCSSLPIDKEIVVPDAKIPAPPIVAPQPGGTYQQRYLDSNPKAGWCQWPTTVRIITQYFTYYHNGLDIATPWGQWPPILACAGGTVIRAGWDPYGLGLHVSIDHGNGYQTVYGHMSSIKVSVGQDVEKGQVIGIMGNTGRSTGPHVHFIIKYKGTPQNPLNYIR